MTERSFSQVSEDQFQWEGEIMADSRKDYEKWYGVPTWVFSKAWPCRKPRDLGYLIQPREFPFTRGRCLPLRLVRQDIVVKVLPKPTERLESLGKVNSGSSLTVRLPTPKTSNSC